MICGVSRLQLTSLPMNGMWCGFYVVGWALEHPSSLSTARPGVGDRILPTRRPGYVFPTEYVQRTREDKPRYVQSCNRATLIQENRGQAYSSRCLWLLLKTLLFYSWLNRYEKLVWKPSLWSDIITIGWVLSLFTGPPHGQPGWEGHLCSSKVGHSVHQWWAGDNKWHRGTIAYNRFTEK